MTYMVKLLYKERILVCASLLTFLEGRTALSNNILNAFTTGSTLEIVKHFYQNNGTTDFYPSIYSGFKLKRNSVSHHLFRTIVSAEFQLIKQVLFCFLSKRK